MFLWNVEKCLNVLGNCYVSSDSDKILHLAKAAGAIPIKRPRLLCGDTPNIPVYQHAMAFMGGPDVIIAVQANSPTLDESLIQITKEIFLSGCCKELMTCHPNRKLYGSIWAIEWKRLDEYGDPYKPKPEILLVDESIDIHTIEDFKKACLMFQ